MKRGAQVPTSEPRDGVSVVIPCLNEEASIAQVVEMAKSGIADLAVPGEVIVVDNGSSDESKARAREAGAIVLEESQRGYGAAIRCGFAAAQHTVLVMADGDLTYNLTKLGLLVKPILDGRADFMLGNRMNGVHAKAMPFLHKHVGNPLLTRLVRIMFHRRDIKDAHTGFRAVRKDVYERMGCITTGMEFASEMIVRAIHAGIRIEFRDIEYHPRTGESKLRTFRDGWRHLRFLLLHSPSMVFVFPGLLVWTLSLVATVPLAVGPVMVGDRKIDIHAMLVIGVLNIASMVFISTGILAKAYAHLSGIRHDPFIAWLYRQLSFEAGAIVSGVLMLVGGFFGGYVVWQWVTMGFGDLDMVRPLFFGATCIINGAQLGAASYLFSIMALPRRIDTVVSEDRETAIREIP
jgi:glycosyltransferase involved in cell wall biosynthesis